MKKTLITTLLATIAHVCWSQVDVALQTTYELPIDELKWIYKPAPNYMLSVAKTDKYKKKRTAWGVILGYGSFKPKASTFYYLVNEDELGTIRYDNYQILQLSVQGRRDFILNKKLEFFIGVEAGYLYAKYSYVSEDPYIEEDATVIDGRVGIAPKVGLNIILTEHIGIFIQSRYTISMASSDKVENIMNYMVSGGAGLNFRFE